MESASRWCMGEKALWQFAFSASWQCAFVRVGSVICEFGESNFT